MEFKEITVEIVKQVRGKIAVKITGLQDIDPERPILLSEGDCIKFFQESDGHWYMIFTKIREE